MNYFFRLLKYLKPHKKNIIISLISLVIVGITSSGTAYLVKPVLDDIFINKNVHMLYLIPIVVILLYLIKGFFDFLQSYFIGYIGQRIITDIRQELFENIMFFPMNYFNKTPTGTIISRLIYDVSLLQNAVTNSLSGIIKDSVTIVSLMVVAFIREPVLASITFYILPIAVFPVIKLGKKSKKVSKKNQEQAGGLSSSIHESITGIKIVKAFLSEKLEIDKFKEENERFFKTIMKKIKYRAISSPLMELIGAFAAAFVIWYGGYQVIKGNSTPGVFFSFLTAVFMMYQPIKGISKRNFQIQESVAAAERIFTLIDKEKEKDTGKIEFKEFKRCIKFENVYFKYNKESVEYDLKDINLEIPKKKKIALVGESGGGKSTIVNLIPRFYDVDKGRILIDDIDIREYTLTSLRKNISIVSQDIILFNDTIENNIKYGKPDATFEEIVEAAKSANAYDFIIKLPEGFKTNIGEKGIRLSGGEKQRISIARAFLKNSPILLLDEATASLDSEAEKEVQKALEKLLKDKTAIIVAHRLSTIIDCDVIYVLKNGEIVEQGTHNELIKHKREYFRLYTLQTRLES